ncbi:MAG: type I methionyl aminopeptidase [Candidatus Staskawiczbacteria bacterium RIFCSPLOWO2_01_FULL_40_39]|uniref:Methionine aminopeptidase n=1 Tax=Candidatus Staskawiczbacteria bacterium RIFCSPHIGHO2_01_FULL_39_25 TaxID=1802202 RepID=A0A1G2HR05_9BACT|nr:MAG: type I methionyl aminopeptidase [Candidatus Staskawiczbacteria bacterium RIFCSPHIGHO2_01_FULL_39_25]OGZ72669.1 MAG: type I methionyl aminopeptidase [Candidatus Staskawiczbacteria bacterium RIFCSPLOWO2_01_FULL_40_39]
MIHLKTSEEVQIMAEGGKILATALKEIEKMAKPGITTLELDRAAEALILKHGAKPAFKGYEGFPYSLCASVNDVIVHGFPSNYRLKEGDIVGLDLGVLYKGYNTDMAVTVAIGEVSFEARRLLTVAKKALRLGIKKARAGITTGDIGNTIQRYIEDQGYGVVRDLCGHGIGKEVHEEPQVPNYGDRHKGTVLKEGMVICIEPMVTVGSHMLKRAKDGYGFATKDGLLAAHFEHTVAITKDGCKVLTEI